MTAPWCFFDAVVRCVDRLSPTLVGVTFTGDDLEHFADNGYDQRFKLVLPLADCGLAHLPRAAHWYAQWRTLPEHRRNPIRTYTARAVRPALREVDVVFALHGDAGPASAWARNAAPGQEVAFLGPDARYAGDHGGVEFRPGHVPQLLLVGDETALPAIASIVERLPSDATGSVFVEVPHRADVIDLGAPQAMTVTFLGRDGLAPGDLLVPAVKAVALPSRSARVAPPDVNVDEEILWEVPESVGGDVYAWLAGEAAVIRTVRRYLVTERGLDRRSVAFMGYWRLGRAEAT